jgi:hypothetical protein
MGLVRLFRLIRHQAIGLVRHRIDKNFWPIRQASTFLHPWHIRLPSGHPSGSAGRTSDIVERKFETNLTGGRIMVPHEKIRMPVWSSSWILALRS